jgi:hypothetical protein
MANSASGDRQPRRKSVDYSSLNSGKVNAHSALRGVGITRSDRFRDGAMLRVTLSGSLRVGALIIAESQTDVGANLPQQRVQCRGQVISRAGRDRLMKDQIGGAGIDISGGCRCPRYAGYFQRGSAQGRKPREAWFNG